MEPLRRLPETLRQPFRIVNAEPLSWRALGGFTLAGVGLLIIGAALALSYCEYRRARDFELTRQVVALGQQCIGTISEVVPGAFVLAQQRPRLVAHVVSDSVARERRWMTPPSEVRP